jgi:hypothetical protein
MPHEHGSDRLWQPRHVQFCLTGTLVLLDNFTLDAREMWEAPFAAVSELLVRTKSKARERGALSVAEFKTVARRVWPEAFNALAVSSSRRRSETRTRSAPMRARRRTSSIGLSRTVPNSSRRSRACMLRPTSLDIRTSEAPHHRQLSASGNHLGYTRESITIRPQVPRLCPSNRD